MWNFIQKPVTVLLAATVVTGSPQNLRRGAIHDCLSAAEIPQEIPGTDNWTQAIKPYNIRLPFTPVALAVPETVQHVQDAVTCGRELGITISARSGGHSYASHSLGGEDGHLVIDLKLFHDIKLDPETGIAQVGPGARLGNTALALWEQGKKAISHGTCPGVGVGGHVLHGGYGFSSHTRGLALDNLVAADVVLADGSFVTASANENCDLFWALRGAGASFGIVTKFHFQTFDAPEQIIIYSHDLKWQTKDAAITGFKALQDYTNIQPTEMNTRLLIASGYFVLSGVYYGTQEGYEAAIAPLLEKVGTPTNSSVQNLAWIDSLRANAQEPLEMPLDYDYHSNFFAKSLMTRWVTDEAVEKFVDYWYDIANSSSILWFAIIDLHGGVNSAITKVPHNATSYAHRSATLKYEFNSLVFPGETYPENGIPFLNDFVGTITETMKNETIGMYVNYADPTLTAEQAHKVYWLDHYERLAEIKEALDPGKLFENPQAILSPET
ncbi:Glucooligosaccharide oxidase [Patellaria atrata CBS 101060]|uniref:Glucooligosaccharide oxidase n=1 Tax=Patellaria atrata CBS 101060 TaxID=1346257 RepID=A0A9P4SBP5_9PEZI|nr:Glucooligosaccharide oxidase [Patellaria atrata CBS 101060]